MKTTDALQALQDGKWIHHTSWLPTRWLIWHHHGHPSRYLCITTEEGLEPVGVTLEHILKLSDEWEVKDAPKTP